MLFSQGQYLPAIKDSCNYCGLCLEICPGAEVNFMDIYKYENTMAPKDIFIGQIIDAYVCHTRDKEIRRISSSGGMITSLLIELIKKKLYEGCFVLPFGTKINEFAKVIYTKDTDLIKSASKSKYLPASVENVVAEITRSSNSIIVGIPCQIHGIKKFCLKQAVDYSNVLFFGLFCEKTLNYNLLDYYQWNYNEGKAIKKFEYKSKDKDGWPGNTKITFQDETEKFIDRRVRMRLKKYYQLNRCLYCIDKFNQLADISFGDCYIKGKETKQGQSNILIRTLKGKQALETVQAMFVMQKIDPSLILHSQNIVDKYENLKYCQLFNKRYNHIIFTGLQDINLNKANNTISNLDKYTESKYNEALKLIDLGKSKSNFTRIKLLVKKNQSTKLIKIIINKYVKIIHKLGNIIYY
jgi:coenzyme F420 hydrogenase subunit beta